MLRRNAAVLLCAVLFCAGAEKVPSACAKCGKPDHWSANCCSDGGAWEGLCDKGSTQQHTWAEGYNACIGAAAPAPETERLQKEGAVEMPEKKCTDAAGEPIWCHGGTPSDAPDTVAKTEADSTPRAAADRRAADKRAAQERRAADKRDHDARREKQGASKTDRAAVPVVDTAEPTAAPTAAPTTAPTAAPTAALTAASTAAPTAAPVADDIAVADDVGVADDVIGKHMKELALIHIPKTGGTSLEEAGAGLGYSWGKHFNHSKEGSVADPKRPQCSLWHVPPGMFVTNPYTAFDTFCVTRHPFTRAISQYLFYTAAKDDGCNGPDPTADCPEVVARVCNATGLNAYIHRTALAIRPGVAAITGPSGPVSSAAQAEDCHWLPQWMYIGDGAGGPKLCEHVLRQENLEADMAVLLEGRDEDLRLMRLRQMLAEHRYKAVSSCTLRVDHLDDESRRALLGIFSKDFETLSYDPELPLATDTLPSQAPGAWWRLRQDEKVGLDGYEMEEVYAIRRRRAARKRRMRAAKQTPPLAPLAPGRPSLGQP